MDRLSGTLPVFTSERGKAEVFDAYDAVLRKWPVAYTKLDVPTTFGDTHVIASGTEVAPPVVLLHTPSSRRPCPGTRRLVRSPSITVSSPLTSWERRTEPADPGDLLPGRLPAMVQRTVLSQPKLVNIGHGI
jgi:hypothetical protein